MDARYINPFLSAVQHIFNTKINVPLSFGNPELKKGKVISNEISSIICISGAVSGCIAMTFPEAVALHLASALLGYELARVNGDCTEAINKIANMVAGEAKKGFPKGHTSISIPSAIFGKRQISHPNGIPLISIPCRTNAGRFNIGMALKVQPS